MGNSRPCLTSQYHHTYTGAPALIDQTQVTKLLYQGLLTTLLNWGMCGLLRESVLFFDYCLKIYNLFYVQQ